MNNGENALPVRIMENTRAEETRAEAALLPPLGRLSLRRLYT